MNLLALKGEVSRKRCISYEVRSVRKLFNGGVYYHFLLALLILTALKGGVLDPTANKGKVKVRKTISGIMRRFKVITTDEEILTKALHSDMDDFEDAVIEVSSKENDAEYILTRNAKDFKKSIVKAITPEELLVILRNDVSEESKKT